MQNQLGNQAQRVSAIIDHQSITGNPHCCLYQHVRQAPTALRKQLELFGSIVNPLAIIDRHDITGFSAYSAANYQIQIMNGDRPEALHKLVQEVLYLPFPEHLVIISDDPVFVPLCIKAALTGTHVSIWSPTDRPPPLLTQLNYEVCSLQTILPATNTESPKAIVWLDAENLLFGLYPSNKRLGVNIDLTPIRSALHQVNHTAAVHAYGDFGLLSRIFRCDIVRLFHHLDVVTHQRKSIRGKNSADMAIASAIHIALTEQPDITTVVIGSGDGDFRPVAKYIRQLGKELILISLPGALNGQLKGMAHHVIYIAHKLSTSSKNKGKQLL